MEYFFHLYYICATDNKNLSYMLMSITNVPFYAEA